MTAEILPYEERELFKPVIGKVSEKTWHGVKGGVYTLINTMEEFFPFMEKLRLQKLISVDTETSGLSWVTAHACGIVIGWGVADNYYLPFAHKTGEQQLDIAAIRPYLREVLEDVNVAKVFWNEKFDRHFLRKCGIQIRGTIHDGVVLVHLLDENVKKDLKELSKQRIHKNADQWEKAVGDWRVKESSRRKREFNSLVVSYLGANRTALEDELFPNAFFLGLKKSQITSKLKAHAKDVVFKDHFLAKCKKEDVSYDFVPLDIMAPYACADVHYTLLLFKELIHSVLGHEDLRALYIKEMKLSDRLYKIETVGIKLDIPHLVRIAPDYERDAAENARDIFAEVGQEFNVDSNQQLVEALLKMGVRLTKLTKKGKDALSSGEELLSKHYSVDNETLENLAVEYPFAAKIQSYRSKIKILNTYVKKLPELVDEYDFVHTSFNANVTTGRLAGRNPNTMNIHSREKQIRAAFIVPDPDEWLFLFADLSQVELRLTAHHSQDPTMLAAYPWEGEELDLHSITCAEAVMGKPLEYVLNIINDESHPDFPEVYWFRNIAKRLNFGIVYGAEEGAIQRQVSRPTRYVSREECRLYIDKYFQKYQGVKAWIDRTTRALKKYGYLQNSFGRFRRLPDAQAKEKWKQARAGRQGVNFLIQGDAADIFKTSVVRIGDLLDAHEAKTHIVNLVHDDIQFYLHKSELHLVKKIKEAFEDHPQYSVPIKASLSLSKRDWAAKKTVKDLDNLQAWL